MRLSLNSMRLVFESTTRLKAVLRTRARGPARSDEAAPPILALRNIRLVNFDAVPELAGHLFVHLVESLAVVGEFAAADFRPTSHSEFQEPIRIGQRLAGRADDIRFAV